MADNQRIPIACESDIVTAGRVSQEVAAPLGFSSGELAVIASAISEIARNIVVYAKRGDISLDVVERNGRRGIRIVAVDHGPGIRDVKLAMRDGYSTSRGLGLGLPGAQRLMDEFEISSEPEKGTTVTMIKWGP